MLQKSSASIIANITAYIFLLYFLPIRPPRISYHGQNTPHHGTAVRAFVLWSAGLDRPTTALMQSTTDRAIISFVPDVLLVSPFAKKTTKRVMQQLPSDVFLSRRNPYFFLVFASNLEVNPVLVIVKARSSYYITQHSISLAIAMETRVFLAFCFRIRKQRTVEINHIPFRNPLS